MGVSQLCSPLFNVCFVYLDLACGLSLPCLDRFPVPLSLALRLAFYGWRAMFVSRVDLGVCCCARDTSTASPAGSVSVLPLLIRPYSRRQYYSAFLYFAPPPPPPPPRLVDMLSQALPPPTPGAAAIRDNS